MTPDLGDKSYLYWAVRKNQALRYWVTWNKHLDPDLMDTTAPCPHFKVTSPVGIKTPICLIV